MIFMLEIEAPLHLKSKFLLYTGKINDVAINVRDGNISRFFDQHGVEFYRPDIDRWEAQGTLKIYCPSFLVSSL
jgi:hypothetical protein